jgi:hypothetical protein
VASLVASAHLSGRAPTRSRMPRDPERLPENIASRIQNRMPVCTAMEVQNKFREPGDELTFRYDQL